MAHLITSYSPTSHLLQNNFLNPSENLIAKPTHKEVFKNARKLVSLKINAAAQPFWFYLTQGIPLLIKTLSLFCKGMTRREKIGEALSCWFQCDNLSRLQLDQASQFFQYNELPLSILNNGQLHKASEIYHQTLALMKKEQPEKQLTDQYHSIIALLEKNKNWRLSRRNITYKDWQLLDRIDYEISKDYFSNLSETFNSDWFKSLDFPQKMMRRFKVDYHEAMVAESLSLSVAYIEGLEGKTLSLPFLDKETGLYHPVSYTIKEFFLGDTLPCYIFESEDLQVEPWLVIRGTRLYKYRSANLESFLADVIDYNGIATKVINKSLVHRRIVKKDNVYVQKESLSDVFNQWHIIGKKVFITGHSLGGVLANTIAVEFPAIINKVYAFSAPGVTKKTGLKYQQLVSKVHDKIINFDFEGDVIPSGGHCLIGRHLSIKSVSKFKTKRRPLIFYKIHVCSHLNRDFQLQNVDIIKENNKNSRVFLEKTRVIVGQCFRLLLHVFGGKHLPDWWKRRAVYKQCASLQRSINAVVQVERLG